MLKTTPLYLTFIILALAGCSPAAQDTQAATKTPLQTSTITDTTTVKPAETPRYKMANKSSEQAADSFINKRYSIKGSWSVDKADGQNIISFSDDFKTKGGPDLKVYLSTRTIAELENGDVENSSVKISVLKSNRGEQSYIVPTELNLSDYKSVVIHCEAFSMIWGGFNL